MNIQAVLNWHYKNQNLSPEELQRIKTLLSNDSFFSDVPFLASKIDIRQNQRTSIEFNMDIHSACTPEQRNQANRFLANVATKLNSMQGIRKFVRPVLRTKSYVYRSNIESYINWIARAFSTDNNTYRERFYKYASYAHQQKDPALLVETLDASSKAYQGDSRRQNSYSCAAGFDDRITLSICAIDNSMNPSTTGPKKDYAIDCTTKFVSSTDQTIPSHFLISLTLQALAGPYVVKTIQKKVRSFPEQNIQRIHNQMLNDEETIIKKELIRRLITLYLNDERLNNAEIEQLKNYLPNFLKNIPRQEQTKIKTFLEAEGFVYAQEEIAGNTVRKLISKQGRPITLGTDLPNDALLQHMSSHMVDEIKAILIQDQALTPEMIRLGVDQYLAHAQRNKKVLNFTELKIGKQIENNPFYQELFDQTIDERTRLNKLMDLLAHRTQWPIDFIRLQFVGLQEPQRLLQIVKELIDSRDELPEDTHIMSHDELEQEKKALMMRLGELSARIIDEWKAIRINQRGCLTLPHLGPQSPLYSKLIDKIKTNFTRDFIKPDAYDENLLLLLQEYIQADWFNSKSFLETVKAGYSEFLKLFHDKHIRIENKYYQFAWKAASEAADLRTLEFLFEFRHDFKIQIEPYCLDTALITAINQGRLDIGQFLIERGANTLRALENMSEWQSPMLYLLRKGDCSSIKWLLDQGVSFDSPLAGTDGKTALHLASESNQLSGVHLLLENGVPINCYDDHGKTALMLAAESQHPAIIKTLINAGADINVHINQTPLLIYAIEHDWTTIVDLLLEKNVDPQFAVMNNRADFLTPILIAAEKGNLAIIMNLMSKGARTDSVNNQGWNPLHLVAHHGHDHCVQSLINHGAVVDDLFFQICLKNNRSVLLKKIRDEKLRTFSLKDVFLALYYWHIKQALLITGLLLKAFFVRLFAKPKAVASPVHTADTLDNPRTGFDLETGSSQPVILSKSTPFSTHNKNNSPIGPKKNKR
jgi:ankyrin repeat protein